LQRLIELAEYTAGATAAACQALSVVQSSCAVDGPGGVHVGQRRGRVVHSTLKVEFVHRHRFATRAEARIKIATWIADFHNTTRRHSATDGPAPIPFQCGCGCS
jgi:hypothetical protein